MTFFHDYSNQDNYSHGDDDDDDVDDDDGDDDESAFKMVVV